MRFAKAAAIVAILPVGPGPPPASVLDAADRFAAAIGLGTGRAPLRATEFTLPGSRDAWELTYPSFKIIVDKSNDTVIGFTNTQQIGVTRKRDRRTGQRRCANENEAMDHARSVARRIGLPESAVLASFEMVEDGSPNLRGADFAGFVRVTYGGVDRGYPYVGSANGMSLTFDVQDGALFEFAQGWDCVPRSWERAINRERAIELATQFYDRHNSQTWRSLATRSPSDRTRFGSMQVTAPSWEAG